MILVRASFSWRLTSAEKDLPAIFIMSERRMVPIRPPALSSLSLPIMLIMLLWAKTFMASLMTAAVSLLASRSTTRSLME